MPVFDLSAARPRQELALAIVEGEGQAQGLIYDDVLPDFPINRRTAHLIKATLQDTLGLRHIAAPKYVRAPGTLFERAVAKFGEDTITVTLRGMEIVIPNEVGLDYDEYLDTEAFFARRFGSEVSALTKEFMAQAALFNTTTFGAATNSSVAYTAANLATIDFIADAIAATRRLKGKGEAPPYVMVMSGLVFERIRLATKVQGFVSGTLRAGQEATLSMIEQSLQEFGVKKVLVGDSYYNNAADGAAPSLLTMWPTTYIWVGKAGLGEHETDEGVSVPSLGGVGCMAYWEGFSPGGVTSTDKDSQEFEGGNYVESYPDIKIDSMVLRLKLSSQAYIGNTRAGDLINPQYS